MIEAGRPPLPQLPTEPVICVLPLIWTHNATTNALGLRQPLTGADGLAQHQECFRICNHRERSRNQSAGGWIQLSSRLQQLYSLPPSAPPLLTDGGGPPTRASASAPETVHFTAARRGRPQAGRDTPYESRVLPWGRMWRRRWKQPGTAARGGCSKHSPVCGHALHGVLANLAVAVGRPSWPCNQAAGG